MDNATPTHENRPGRPGQQSPQLAARNADWLAMNVTLFWSVARIAKHVRMSTRAVKAGLAAARREADRPTNRDAVLADRTLRDIYTLPTYRNDPAVREWLQAERGKPR